MPKPDEEILLDAIENGDFSQVKSLLSKDVNPNFFILFRRSPYGLSTDVHPDLLRDGRHRLDRDTPLLEALRKGHTCIANMLVEETQGRLLLHPPLAEKDKEEMSLTYWYTLAGMATKAGAIAIVKTIFTNQKLNVNQPIHWFDKERCHFRYCESPTFLYLATMYGHQDLVEFFLSLDADIDCGGKTFETDDVCLSEGILWPPLYIAAENGHVDIVKTLLSKKASTYMPSWTSQYSEDDCYDEPLVAPVDQKDFDATMSFINEIKDALNRNDDGIESLTSHLHELSFTEKSENYFYEHDGKQVLKLAVADLLNSTLIESLSQIVSTMKHLTLMIDGRVLNKDTLEIICEWHAKKNDSIKDNESLSDADSSDKDSATSFHESASSGSDEFFSIESDDGWSNFSDFNRLDFSDLENALGEYNFINKYWTLLSSSNLKKLTQYSSFSEIFVEANFFPNLMLCALFSTISSNVLSFTLIKELPTKSKNHEINEAIDQIAQHFESAFFNPYTFFCDRFSTTQIRALTFKNLEFGNFSYQEKSIKSLVNNLPPTLVSLCLKNDSIQASWFEGLFKNIKRTNLVELIFDYSSAFLSVGNENVLISFFEAAKEKQRGRPMQLTTFSLMGLTLSPHLVNLILEVAELSTLTDIRIPFNQLSFLDRRRQREINSKNEAIHSDLFSSFSTWKKLISEKPFLAYSYQKMDEQLKTRKTLLSLAALGGREQEVRFLLKNMHEKIAYFYINEPYSNGKSLLEVVRDLHHFHIEKILASVGLTLLRNMTKSGDYEFYLKQPDQLSFHYGVKKHCFIDGDAIHNNLLASEHSIRDKMTEEGKIKNAQDKEGQNTVVATLGFVVSDGAYSQHGKKEAPGKAYITFPVQNFPQNEQNPCCDLATVYGISPSNVTLQLMDSSFSSDLEKMVGMAEAKMVEELKTKNTPIPNYKNASQRNYFYLSNYSHSETAVMTYLMRPDVVQKIAEKLREVFNEKYKLSSSSPGKIYALIFHLHTFRYMCENCSELAFGFQQVQSDFLARLTSKLQSSSSNFWISSKRETPRMLTMVSAEVEYKHRKTASKPEDRIIIPQPNDQESLAAQHARKEIKEMFHRTIFHQNKYYSLGGAEKSHTLFVSGTLPVATKKTANVLGKNSS